MSAVGLDFFNSHFNLTEASCTISIGGADYVQLNNGVVVVPMQGNRVLTIGPASTIIASPTRLIAPDAMLRIAVGPGASDGVQLTELPSHNASVVQPANLMLANLHIVAASLVAAGGGNLVAAGGGNMVAAGGGNLVGNDGASLIGNDGSTFTSIAALVAAGGGNLIGNDGSTLIRGGRANLLAAGSGNIVSVGAAFRDDPEVIAALGENNAALMAAGGGNLIGQDGATMVAAGGGNMVAAGGGNILPKGGAPALANSQ
ncbi:MAG: hypothetical protein JWO08_1699, partial [Verrucomicrobiaceae bacterium]|nr:hypothetical protein [Verrucomicrobiaceae bacterium]